MRAGTGATRIEDAGTAVRPAPRRPSGTGRYSMTTAGDIMHRGAQWIPAHETLDRAAQLMRELGVGVLPISDENERLCGILTDRDIVVGCVALGHDPSRVTAGDLAQGTLAGSTRAPTSARCSRRCRSTRSAAFPSSRTSASSA
ncbi:hypothetical protein GCM10020256_59140 [Streptomyces thermocoprophilus]